MNFLSSFETCHLCIWQVNGVDIKDGQKTKEGKQDCVIKPILTYETI